MNPESNRFEKLSEVTKGDSGAATLEEITRKVGEAHSTLLRPDGTPVPKHWSVFRTGETVVVKSYTFRVDYIGEQVLLLVPVGPLVVGGQAPPKQRDGEEAET